MKRMSLILVLVVIAASLSGSAFAQGRGQGGRPAGGGAQSNGGVFPGNRPSNPGPSNAGIGADHRPDNHGVTPQSSGKSADHKPDLTGPKDSMGFKNYGQYVAAKHVSENLGIPFGDVRGAMVNGHLSLGEAIHKFRPDLNQHQVQAETKKGEEAAKKAEAEAKKNKKVTSD
jgi:hypothetical protein